MNSFYIPFVYLFKSRLKTKMNKISWFIIYIIPIYFIGLSVSNTEILDYSFIFIFSVVVFNSVYELGYLENDIQTTKKEVNPTHRIDKKTYDFLNNDYSRIIAFKIISILLFLVFIYSLFKDDVFITNFIIGLVAIRSFFYLHNKIRNQFNILTFFLLSSTKYMLPLSLILNLNELISIWYILFLFPILRTIEHSTKIKYRLNNWAEIIGNHDLFRVKYYLLILIVSIYFYFTDLIECYFIFYILYFLIYRTASYILVNKNIYKRTNTGQSNLSIKG